MVFTIVAVALLLLVIIAVVWFVFSPRPTGRVWDCFMYNGEEHALQSRLQLPGIHRRVLVEGNMTHSGEPQGRFYGQNLPDVIAVHADLSTGGSAWERENMQRNALMHGLDGAASDDLVLISDADEIPTSDAIRRASVALTRGTRAVVLSQTMYNYSREWKVPHPWNGTIATTRGHLDTVSPQALRDQRNSLPQIADGGEHLSFFGGSEEIKRKLRSFAHTEYAHMATDDDAIAAQVAGGQDLFGRWGLEAAGSLS